MVTKHPKLIIIDYYDLLIRNVDIYTEEQLKKYTDENVIEIVSDDLVLDKYSEKYENNEENPIIMDFESPNANIYDLIDKVPYWRQSIYKYPKESEKAKNEPPPLLSNVHKFLNNMRDEMIDELKKGQEAALKNYEKIKNEIKVDKLASEEEFDRSVVSRLFEKQFMFLLLDNKYESKNNSPFKLYLIVLDFYLNKHEKEILR